MENKLKYRLVGAGVIVAIMAFFLPLILDSKKYRTEIVSQIPPMPKQDTSQMSKFEAEQLALEEKVKAAKQQNSNSTEGQLFIDLDVDPDKAVTEVKPQTPAAQKNIVKDTLKTEQTVTEVENTAVKNVKAQSVDLKKAEDSNIAKKAQDKPKSVDKIQELKQESKKTADTAAKDTSKKVAQATSKKASAKKPTVKKPTVEPKKQEPKPKPTLKENYYLVQIGTFSNKANASKLVTNLREKEYRAYERVSDKFSRVFVGPYPDKKSAEKRAKNLEAVVGSKVKIVVFDPIVH